MKTLLKILVALVSVVLFARCSIYQHVKLEGNTPLTDKLEFLVENDSIRIIYSFYGQGGPIHMDIFNKLDRPFCVDWGKSALIIEGQSISLWKDEARFKGLATEYKIIPENDIINSTTNMEGTIVRKDKVTFIPPQSNISVNSYNVQTKFFNTPEQPGKKAVFYTPEGKRRGRRFSFSKEDSPLNFRIFLSFSMDESFKTPFEFDNTFWVSDYFITSTSPKALAISPGNQFYNRK